MIQAVIIAEWIHESNIEMFMYLHTALFQTFSAVVRILSQDLVFIDQVEA